MSTTPTPSRQTLLRTEAQSLPADIAETARAVCESHEGVDRVYLCWVAIECEGMSPKRRLLLGVKLNRTVEAPQDLPTEVSLVRRLRDTDVRFGREVGIALLADRAVNAWEANGVQVYP